jgi:hypothetical protein
MQAALTSSPGTLELAIAALLLVLGLRLLRPARLREWIGLVAYAAAVAIQLFGASGLISGAVPAASFWQRILGMGLLVAGLLLTGAPARARRRVRPRGGQPKSGADALAHVGLALVVAGQYLRGPSTAGLVASAIGVVVNAACALVARRDGGLESGPFQASRTR